MHNSQSEIDYHVPTFLVVHGFEKKNEHDRISSLILDEDRAMENNLSSEPSDRLDEHFVDWLNFMHALQYGNGGSDSHHAG